jgi:hypothetical protein
MPYKTGRSRKMDQDRRVWGLRFTSTRMLRI